MLDIKKEKVKEFIENAREQCSSNENYSWYVGAYIYNENLNLYITCGINNEIFQGNYDEMVDLREYCSKEYYTLDHAVNLAYKDITSMLYEYIVDDCIRTEVDECCHDDKIGDYENPLLFYLSSIEKDDYIEYLVDRYEINKEYAEEIKKSVIEGIKEVYEEVKEIDMF